MGCDYGTDKARPVSTPCEFIDPPIPPIRRRRERERKKGIFLFLSFFFPGRILFPQGGRRRRSSSVRARAHARTHTRTQSFTNSKVRKTRERERERDFWLISFSIPRSGACRFASFDSYTTESLQMAFLLFR